MTRGNLAMRALGVILPLAAALLLSAMLTATIYWTLFDPMWIAFLGGVLFAAMLAVASRASTVEWRLARRTLQVKDLREKLALEVQRTRAATKAFQACEERMRVLLDALPSAVPPRAEHDEHARDPAILEACAQQAAEDAEPKARLVQALKDDQFLLLAQPMQALQPAAAVPACCEILLRLKEEEENLLPPGSFFPVAERHGMMEDLDRWVVRELITRCHEHGRDPAPAQAALYCVNLSRAAVRSHAFGRFVQEQLLERDLDGRSLCFEIAEHDVVACHAEVAQLMALLKPFGCRFTVDAFGSVKGTFSPLRGLAFDFVKIDGVVVQNIRPPPAEQAKVRAIVAVCHRTGMRTIAEFVEDTETLEMLRNAGVDYAQGFGIARPAPLLDFHRHHAALPALAAAA